MERVVSPISVSGHEKSLNTLFTKLALERDIPLFQDAQHLCCVHVSDIESNDQRL